jgi:adenylyltransferase/sulfurtransferase
MSGAVQPDYSRQSLLKEIGPVGQATLARSRVLIVGAGGLGSPVLQYLAGAGVGFLGLVDADTLEAGNLHRQPIYALADVGRKKADLALDAVHRINPTVHVETHAVRFDSGNALALVRNYDVVVDCSDNFRTKYLINDAAVLAQRPAVFASVYQYEGQLQVYKPQANHACLRCLWPDAIADGIVGNCAEAGVLGPVPGAFGALQALLTLKILVGMSGQLDGELLLLDFTNFSSVKLKAPRRAECGAPECAHIRKIAADETEHAQLETAQLEIRLDSLASAAQHGLEVIDIRTAAEFAAAPSPGRNIAMPVLLENPGALPEGREFLLVCASGKRSLAAARELHKRGIAVRSLAGGLGSLRN